MPFTPFHMGPGSIVKVTLGKRFSLMVFGISQIMIDIEPLVRLIRGDKILHGITHTYLGAFVIGLSAIFIGRFFSLWFIRLWNSAVINYDTRWFKVNPNISWLAAVTGALVGTFSHVFLDSIMHTDMIPFNPFSDSNGLWHIIPVITLHHFCLITGLIGFLIISIIWFWKRLGIYGDR